MTAVLLALKPDDLLQPIRAMGGKPAPGASLGGWYAWKPDYDYHHDTSGLAPASTLDSGSLPWPGWRRETTRTGTR